MPLYRLYRSVSGNHFYTTSIDEANNAASGIGYNREGIAGFVSSTTSSNCQLKPVYRLYKSGAMDDHFYTTNEFEASTAEAVHGYKREGIAYYCAASLNDCGASLAFYRYYRGSDHFYTADLSEGHNVVAGGGTFEGILCYIWA